MKLSPRLITQPPEYETHSPHYNCRLPSYQTYPFAAAILSL